MFELIVGGSAHSSYRCILDAIAAAKHHPVCTIVRSDGVLMYERRRPQRAARVFVMPARMRGAA